MKDFSRQEDIQISAEILAKSLKIKLEKLYEICDKLKLCIDENEWHIKEGVHYKVVNKNLGTLTFTPEGVIQLAKYTEEEIDNKNILRRIMTLIDRCRAKLVQSLVISRVSDLCSQDHENGSKIIISNGKAFVTTVETRRILRLHTRQDILAKARNYEQKGDSGRAPMQPNKHFLISPDHKHELYSAEGIKRLSMGLQVVCKSKTTKTWNKAVESTIFEALGQVTKGLILEDKELTKSITKAKKLANSKCELTGVSKNKINPGIELCGHHLYDRTHYPHLSRELKNIIIIEKSLHKQFHEHMGGNQKRCTAKDFLAWLENNAYTIYGQSDQKIELHAKAILNLNQRVKMLSPLINQSKTRTSTKK